MIKAYESQSVHNSLVDALVEQEIRRQNALAAVQRSAEMEAAKRDNTMMRIANRRYWSGQIARAEEDYGYNPDPPAAVRLLEGWAGLALLTVAGQWRRLMEALDMAPARARR